MLFILTGLFAGVLLGFGTALVLQNRDIHSFVPFLNHRADTLVPMDEKPVISHGKVKKTREDDTGDSMADQSDSLLTAGSFDTESESQSLFASDTLSSPPSYISSGGAGDAVLRDEMIGSRKVRVIWDDEKPAKGDEESDSLLARLTSVKPPDGLFQEYTIEFWRNPLNYRGYRISRDKLVIFGLPPEQTYQLRYTSGQLTLVSGRQVYPLKESGTFIPLIPKK